MGCFLRIWPIRVSPPKQTTWWIIWSWNRSSRLSRSFLCSFRQVSESYDYEDSAFHIHYRTKTRPFLASWNKNLTSRVHWSPSCYPCYLWNESLFHSLKKTQLIDGWISICWPVLWIKISSWRGKKPISSIFSKSTSGLEIIDPFCDPRDSENHPISYSLSAVLIEFQRSRSLSKRILWSVLLSLSPERKSTGNRDRSRGLKIHSTEKGVLVADTEVLQSLATEKVEFGTSQRGKQRGLEIKGQFQTKDLV